MMQKFNPQKTKYLKAANAVLSVFYHEKKAEVPLDLYNAEHILVIDAGRIGDIVMSIPFLKTLKRNAPRAKITLVCGSWAEEVLRGQGLADCLIAADTEALGSPAAMLRKRRQLGQVLRQVNRICYDIALEPRGDLRYIFFMHYCRAKRKVSYSYTGGECFLTDIITPPQKAVHLVEDKLYFAKQAGCRVFQTDRYPKLILTAEQKEENQAFIQRHGLLGKQIIGIHPGASLKIKQWDGFRELAAKLAADAGSRAFLIFEGPGEEETAGKAAQAVRKCGAQAVISRTGLAQYLQRLALCHAVICNDSGAGHIARAYGVTVFVIFGPVEPAFARPYAQDRVYVFSDDSLACKPCFQTSCPKVRQKGQERADRPCFWKFCKDFCKICFRGQKEQMHSENCACLKQITVRQVYEKYLSVQDFHMPTVSVILPLYNGQPFIRHTISRIRAQTFQDWELLVINDGSTDRGEEIALREAQTDRRIRVFRKPNGGISSARNYGLAKAAGTYIAFADQDDTAGKNWLKALLNGMAGDADLAVGGKKLTVADASGKTVACRVCRYEDTLLETEEELHGFLFQQENDASSQHVWNCMYKKELIDAHGIRFDENLAMGMEDVLFNICYGYYCRKIHKIPQIVYSYTQRAGISTSAKYNPDLAKEYAHRMQTIAQLFGFSDQNAACRTPEGVQRQRQVCRTPEGVQRQRQAYRTPEGVQRQRQAYQMYGDYALRELCNLYYRSNGKDSFGLLAGLRDAYVEHVPEKVPFCQKHFRKGTRKAHCEKKVFGKFYFGKDTAGKVCFGKDFFRRILYIAADDLLRKKRYFPLILLKRGRNICRQMKR